MCRDSFGVRHAGRVCFATAVFLAGAAGTPVGADLIDFEDLDTGPIEGEKLTIESGGIDVTFAGPGLNVRQFGSPFPNTRVLSTRSDAGPLTVTFEDGFSADFVELENIINGRFTSEIDIMHGTAFDIDDEVLDFQANSDTIHRLEGPGIVKSVYIEHERGMGFVMDNFNFAPEPGSLSILAGGALLAFGRRRGAARRVPARDVCQ